MRAANHVTAAQNYLNACVTQEDFEGAQLTETGSQTMALCAIAHSLIAIAKSLP